MQIITKTEELKKLVHSLQGKTVGLVPTMGALHEGHLSLVERSKKENDVTFVSVFVNPTQFNNKNDLVSYPRTLDADAALLKGLAVDYVFAPTVEEVYPEEDTRHFAYPPITDVMEGSKRPGHFNGVCQIVSKLFVLVQPMRAYFGEKDFQQIAVVKAMVKDLALPVEIVSCPIVREDNGLALSSRNSLLSDAERQIAVNISRILFESVKMMQGNGVKAVHDWVVAELDAIEGLEVEYYNIVDADSLQEITDWAESEHIQGCITVYCGAKPVRLIDNVKYK